MDICQSIGWACDHSLLHIGCRRSCHWPHTEESNSSDKCNVRLCLAIHHLCAAANHLSPASHHPCAAENRLLGSPHRGKCVRRCPFRIFGLEQCIALTAQHSIQTSTCWECRTRVIRNRTRVNESENKSLGGCVYDAVLRRRMSSTLDTLDSWSHEVTEKTATYTIQIASVKMDIDPDSTEGFSTDLETVKGVVC